MVPVATRMQQPLPIPWDALWSSSGSRCQAAAAHGEAVTVLQTQTLISEPSAGMGTCGRKVSLPRSAARADLLSSIPSCSSTCDLDYNLYRDDFPYRCVRGNDTRVLVSPSPTSTPEKPP